MQQGDFEWFRAEAKDILNDNMQLYDNQWYMYQLLLNARQELGFENKEYREWAMKLSKYTHEMADYMSPDDMSGKYYELYWDLLLLEAPWIFDSYITYMEKNRAEDKKFYAPRKKTLHVVAQDLQDLEDRLIEFYGLSMPSRVGKSTMCIFFMSWVMGKRPNSHSAMGGHSGKLAKGFYGELLNLIETREYTYGEIFPHSKLQKKSADDFEINLDKPDRFATMTCRGIEGTWTGAVDISADGYLYVDDLVRDRQHSLSPSRLDGTYQEYLNKMVDRKIDGARELMVGTRWNLYDPLGRIEKENRDNPLYRFRKIPAINDDGESNFDYSVNGFSTKYYVDMKSRLDLNEWEAKFQQKPFLREGIMFAEDELRYYNGILPEGGFVKNVSACDVAWGGGDSLSMPVGAEYENGDVYIFDWIFNKGPKEVTLPLVVGRIMGNEIQTINFEANNGGEMYEFYVSQRLQEHKYPCSCTNSKAPSRQAKKEKINQYSGDVKRNFIFLSPKYQSKEYKDAMEEFTTFVYIGDNDHDDAPDGITQLAMRLYGKPQKPSKVIHSPY